MPLSYGEKNDTVSVILKENQKFGFSALYISSGIYIYIYIFLKFGIVSNCWIFFLPKMFILSYFPLLLGIQSQLEEAGTEVKLQLKKMFNFCLRDRRKEDPSVQTNAETQRKLFIGKISPTHSEDGKTVNITRQNMLLLQRPFGHL